MEYGYVCFAYSKNEWIARSIAWFTKSKWSHSFVTVPPVLGKEMAMEAAANGVSMTLFDPSYRDNSNQSYEVYRIKADPEQMDLSLLKCMCKLESSYGYLEYPWFVWRAINKFFGRDIKSQDNWSQQGTICSGLTREFIEGCGYADLFKGFGRDSVHAQDIYEIVKSRPDIFELMESKF